MEEDNMKEEEDEDVAVIGGVRKSNTSWWLS